MMWRGSFWFTWSRIDASVEVRPEPASPVTSTIPDGESARRFTPGGSPSASKPGGDASTRRITSPTQPRWRNALTRNRPRPGAEYTKSASRPSRKRSAAARRHDRQRDPLGLVGLDEVERGLAEHAVDPEHGPRSDLQVDVGRALLDGVP